MTTTRTDVHTLEVTDTAAATIRAIWQQAAAIQEAWGRTNPEYGTKALLSANRNIGELFSKFFGAPTKVFRDDVLSLFVTSGDGPTPFCYGLIFFGRHREVKEAVAPDIDMSYGAARTGRYCMSTLDDGKYCAKPFTWRGDKGDGLGVPTCEGHDPLPVTMPIPGEWSFHS